MQTQHMIDEDTTFIKIKCLFKVDDVKGYAAVIQQSPNIEQHIIIHFAQQIPHGFEFGIIPKELPQSTHDLQDYSMAISFNIKYHNSQELQHLSTY